MNNTRISQEAYDKYEDALVGLFMEHYASALTDLVNIQHDNTQDLSFPEALDERCKKLIKKENTKRNFRSVWKTTRQMLRSVAVLAIAVLTVSSLLFVSVDAFRERVVQYYISRGDGFWSVSSDQNHEESSPTHTINFNKEDPLQGLIPQEYKLTTISNTNEQRNTAIYENADGECIRFLSFPGSFNFRVDAENTDIFKEITLKNHQGILTVKNRVVQVTWWNTESNMIYLISADCLTENAVISISEKLVALIDK